MGIIKDKRHGKANMFMFMLEHFGTLMQPTIFFPSLIIAHPPDFRSAEQSIYELSDTQ